MKKLQSLLKRCILKLNDPGEICEEDISLHPIKLFRSLLGRKDMLVGRLKEILNVKLVMKYCYQWKALENTQDRI